MTGVPPAVPTLAVVAAGQVQQAMTVCEKMLLRPENRIAVEVSREWARRFSPDAGVYAVFDKGELIYVGETGSISARMADLLDSRNHVLRRNIGNRLFAEEPDFILATARVRFSDNLEARLNDYLQRRLTVSTVVVPFGRKEIEEHMTAKYHPRYNSKGKRGTKLHGPDGMPESGS